MNPKRRYRWSLKSRQTRLLLYVLALFSFIAWKYVPRPWHPTLTLETSRHIIYSTATREQTEATARALDLLYAAYSNRFHEFPRFQPDHPKLKIKLYQDRDEMRRVNPGLGWAEAYYREPFCRAYFSARESNPFQWLLHEAVHQLNHEVAQLELEKWLEEGVAEYFSTSRIETNFIAVGRLNPDTYPLWWMDELATTDNLDANIRNGSVIPLRAIITNNGGPDMSEQFNLYYLHWWSLTHFIFETPAHRDHALDLVRQGGGLAAFEKIIGPVEQVQREWHDYVRHLKRTLSGQDLQFLKTGQVPEFTNSVAGP